MAKSLKQLEWEFELDLSAIDPFEDPSKLIDLAKAAVKKRWKEEGDDYRKKLEEEIGVLCGDGCWRAEPDELKLLEKDIMFRESVH